MDDLPPPSYNAEDSLNWNRSFNGSSTSVSDVPQSVATLLDATKQLTECLRLWSIERATDEQVSDVYVTVGTKFNLMVTAFMNVGIDTSELYSIPTDLRVHLEDCLGEEASPAVIEEHMPKIRSTLYRLLVGLRGKQEAYWKAVGNKGRQSSGSR